MINNHTKSALWMSAAVAALSCTTPIHALAQDAPATAAERTGTIEEILVTARRRAENIQDTPVAITAVSQETIERRRLVTIADIAKIAPNVQITNTPGALGTASIGIRGISHGDNAPGQDSPVGIYIDGVAAGRNSVAVMDMVEPASVEVLRGPQGTLFGRNTTAGAILINTHVPTDEFSGSVRASYGTFGAKEFKARIDTGLLGDSGIKGSFAYAHRDRNGTQNNLERPRNLDPGAEKNDSYWFKVAGDWDRFRATFTGDYSVLDGLPTMQQAVDAAPEMRAFVAGSPALGGGAMVITQTPRFTVPSYGFPPTLTHVWNQGLSLTLEYDLTDSLVLKSISAVRAYKRQDPSTNGPFNLRGLSTTGQIISFDTGLIGFLDRQQRQRQKSQELQLLGDFGDVNFVLGGYYYKENAWESAITRTAFALATPAALFGRVVDSRSPRTYKIGSKSQAAFAQVNWRPSFLDQKLELSGGIRYTKDSRDFDQTVGIVRTVALDADNTSFMGSVNYRWTEDLMTYVKYSTGYRAGGFNVRSTNPNIASAVYQPEDIKAWEGGFKLDAFDRRARLNAAVFFNKYNDLQTGFYAPPTQTGGGGNITFNSDAKYKGAEVELTVLPTTGMTLTATVGYLDAEYTFYPTGLEAGAVIAGCTPLTSGGVLVSQDCAAISDVPSTPKWTADFSARYEFPASSYGTWSVQADYSYRGAVNWAAISTPSSPFKSAVHAGSFGLLGGRIALSDIPLSGNTRGQISIFGANLTDEHYVVQAVAVGALFGQKTFGTRRTIGVEGRVDF